MSVATFLGAMAISSQGLYDVRLPYGAVRPTSLNMLIVSSSGEGKTAVEQMFMWPLKELQAKQYEKYLLEMEQYEMEMESWQTDHDAYKQKVRSAFSKNHGVATKQKQDVKDHFKSKPKKPRAFKLLYQNSTTEALFKGLNEEMPSAAILTDEGDTFFKSSMAQARGHMNNLFSGDDTIITRVSRPDIFLRNVRFSAFLMIQPGMLEHHLKPQDRDSGWLARFIVVKPPQMRGTRFFNQNSQGLSDLWKETQNRLKDLAEQNVVLLSDPQHKRKVLEFAPDATALWYQLSNDIEREMQVGGRFHECPDHATKLNDIIARVAALLHIFEQYEGGISANTLRIAIEICSAYSDHFREVMMPLPQEIQDAYLLKGFMDQLRSFGNRFVTYNYIRQCGPSALRNKQRLRAAIDVMLAHAEIALFQDRKTRMVDLMPYLGPQPGVPVYVQ